MTALQDTLNGWAGVNHELRAMVSLIETEDHYQKALSAFEYLMEEVAKSPQTPLKSLYLLLAQHIEAYERQRGPLPDAAPYEVLAYLLSRHRLSQSDLPEVGSQGVVSELLSGKRQINARQAKALAQRFGVQADVFL